MPNLHTCYSCGHTFDHDMYEVCPECQRHPDDDLEEDLIEFEEALIELDEADDEVDQYGTTFGMDY